MPSAKCPVCRKSFPDSQIVRDENRQRITALCPKCHSNRFFNDDTKEVKYRKYYKQLEGFVKKHAGDFFDEVIHGRQIAQLARCEVQVEHYERMIGNNDEKTDGPIKLLQSERVHLRAMYGILQASIQSLRGDKKVHEHDIPKDFRTLLRQQLKEASKDGRSKR